MNSMPRSVMTVACFGLGAVPRSGPWLLLGPSHRSKPTRLGAARPACHLPKWADAYPASFSMAPVVRTPSGRSVSGVGGIIFISL